MRKRCILIVCGNPGRCRLYGAELDRLGFQTKVALSAEEGRLGLRMSHPGVTLLDESAAVDPQPSFASAVYMLAEVAPVVVVAAPQRQAQLAFLITSGAIDFVPNGDHCVPDAATLIERRMRLADRVEPFAALWADAPNEQFGEIFRHEVNNPLTGILGNAELLLAWRDRLPSAAVARIETIASLAVRLRETVCRLSYSATPNATPGHSQVQRPSRRGIGGVRPVARARRTAGSTGVSVAGHDPVEE